MSAPSKRENIQSLIDWLLYLQTSGPGVDDTDSARITIGLEHHEIHDGNSYTYPFVDLDVDIAAPKYILLRTPDTTEEQHFTVSVEADGVCEADVYENPTVDVVGDLRTFINRNRRSTNTANCLLYEDPTISLDNLRIAHMELGAAGTGPKKITGEASERDEFVLDRNEDYVVKVSPTADDTHVNITVDIYEVTP